MLSTAARQTRRIGAVSVQVRSTEDAIHDTLGAMQRRQVLRIAFANAHLVYCAKHDPALAELLNSFVVLNDGVGIEILARLYAGGGFPENLNGTDFVPRLLAEAPAGTRVLTIGGQPIVAKVAARVLHAMSPHLEICGSLHGYDLHGGSAELHIRELEPDIVLVGMGNPLQEKLIFQCADRAHAGVFLGVGALFDFITGSVPRAPPWMRAARLEWLYRVGLEPHRMWRRYSVEPATLLADAIVDKCMKRQAPAHTS